MVIDFNDFGPKMKNGYGKMKIKMKMGTAQVAQRADSFIHWISHYPAEQMYSNQCFWQVFRTIPYLNLTYASTLSTKYGAIEKLLHLLYLPDSDLSSG